MAGRPLVLLGIILLSVALAGCNAKDWYNQMGTVQLSLAPVPPGESRLGDLQSLKVAIYGVSIRQYGTVDAKEFSYGSTPEVVDLVELARSGEPLRMAEFKINLRAVDRITLWVDVVEAIDASGTSMQVCRIQDAVERWPCFFMPDNNAFRYEGKPFSPRRGEAVEVGLPLEVSYEARGSKAQYYFKIDPNKLSLSNV